MTETVMPKEMIDILSPTFVAPFMVYLCGDMCKENGSLFEVGGGFGAKMRLERTPGVLIGTTRKISIQTIATQMDSICDFGDASVNKHPDSMNETDWTGLLERAQKLPSVTNGAKETNHFDLKNKIILITGGGAGLGKAYALYFAEQAGIVVVNDLNRRAADEVVEEIKMKYHVDALPCYESVEHGEKIIELIMQKYGRIDVVVNNAGVLRDKSFAKMSDEEWNFVLQTHLHGTFAVCKAAWPIMVKQKFGRIVNTCSAVGLYGNFGQANYSAGKPSFVCFIFIYYSKGGHLGIIEYTCIGRIKI